MVPMTLSQETYHLLCVIESEHPHALRDAADALRRIIRDAERAARREAKAPRAVARLERRMQARIPGWGA